MGLQATRPGGQCRRHIANDYHFAEAEEFKFDPPPFYFFCFLFSCTQV